MCGITGFYGAGERYGRSTLEAMTRCIAHRGPDADGFFTDGLVGLGHRRLSIIDLSSAANQPMQSRDSRYTMVFNGEVYNYAEIANDMQLELRTHSDTEVLLESFARENTQAIERWNGMFAVGLYDRSERLLYLIRDRLGVKPLYYHRDGNNLMFASELKSLLNGVPKEKLTVDRAAVRAFLNLGYIPGPHTIYNEIQKLPSGAYATFDGKDFEVTRYWRPHTSVVANVERNEASALDRFQSLMQSSVRYRMIADVPYGTFLSGGIDSSLVTALAQEASDVPVKTFSIAFNESGFDESGYARAVAQHLGTQHHEFTVTERDAMELTEKMLDAYDEPYADSSGLATMLVAKLARKHVTMVLSGDGGDELFMGYGAYRWARRLDNGLVKAVRRPAAAVLGLMSHRARRAMKVVNYQSEARKTRHIFSQEQYFFSDRELDRMLLQPYGSDVEMNESLGQFGRMLTAAEKQSMFDLVYYLRDDLLVKVDIASMQHALEVRTPFLDYRVVEFALGLHEDLKMKNGTSKHLVKQLLYRYLPKSMFDRPKWGFAVPMKKWLNTDLKYLVDRYTNEAMLQKHDVVNSAQALKIVNAYQNGHEYLFNRVWSLLILHRWLEKHTG